MPAETIRMSLFVDSLGNTEPDAAVRVFDAADNWSFSGSYAISPSVTSVTLTAEALGLWGGTVDDRRPTP